MKKNEWEFNWNPYLKSVPVSKKLILKQRGFDDMANDNKKKPLSLKSGTVSNDILYILNPTTYILPYKRNEAFELLIYRLPF